MTFGKEEIKDYMVAQWLSGRLLDSRGRKFESDWRLCVVSLSKTHLSLLRTQVQPMKAHPDITEKLLTGLKESNQTNKFFHLLF